MAHEHIIGQHGTGTKEYLINAIADVLNDDAAILVLDPHGDIIKDIIPLIPKRRNKHTIVFDPSREDEIDALYPFELIDNVPLVASICAETIKAVSGYTDATPRLWNYLYYSFAALAEAHEPFYGWRYMLTDKRYRTSVLERVRDAEVIAAWRDHESFTLKDQMPLVESSLNQAKMLFADPRIRKSLGLTRSTFDAKSTLDRGILLINLPQDTLGTYPVQLYGSILISLLSHVAKTRNPKRPLYIFLPDAWLLAPSVNTTLVTADPASNIHITLSHQYIAQFKPSCYDAIVGSSASTIVFRTSLEDATTLYDRMDADQKRATRFDQLKLGQYRFSPFWNTQYGDVRPLPVPDYPTDQADLTWLQKIRRTSPETAARAVSRLVAGEISEIKGKRTRLGL